MSEAFHGVVSLEWPAYLSGSEAIGGFLTYDLTKNSLPQIREFMESNSLAFPSPRWYEDPVFFVNVMDKAERYYLIPDVVYRYRVDCKTTKWAPSRVRDLLKGIGYNLDYAKKTGNSTLYTRLQSSFPCRHRSIRR